MQESDPYGTISAPAALGRLVWLRRKETGLTQVDAAALCGVGERFLRELEHGKPTAELGLVMRVLERMGLVVVVLPRGSERLASIVSASRSPGAPDDD